MHDMDELSTSSSVNGGNVAPSEPISAGQKERARRNKEKAMEIRKRRRLQPYSNDNPAPTRSRPSMNGPNLINRDSHAGFIIEDEPQKPVPQYPQVQECVSALPDEQLTCCECGKLFAESYLYANFQLSTCDNCRDPDGKHSLLSKTEAKQRYLLKDCDFGERHGPPLKFLIKRNPHSDRWGEMKLFLLCQVEARAEDIWGGAEGLEREKQNKTARQEKRKERKYAKEIKDLRRAVRSSIVPLIGSSHVHCYNSDSEVYHTEDDTWTKTCSECGYKVTFEKM